MKQRIILVIIGIIIVIGVVIYFVFVWNNGASTGASPSTSITPTNSGQPISVNAAYPDAPNGQQLSLGTASGAVQVNNFYTSSNTQVGEDGVLIISQTNDYWITYDPSDSSFWLAIAGTPFVTVRRAAEQAFLTTLGVSQADACKLDASVGVPYSAGSSASGQSSPLSFCG